MQTVCFLNRKVITRTNLNHSRRYYQHRYHHRNNRSNQNYSFEWLKSKFSNLKWFSASSTILFSASYIRYMEPRTTTTFSEKFENEGNLLEIVYTGYHKWRSNGDPTHHFFVKGTDTFKPHFSYAVYRKKFTINEALKLEKKSINYYDEITDNDYPFHFNRLRKKHEEREKQIENERWENATDEQRRDIVQEKQHKKRQELKQKDVERKRRGTNPKAEEGRDDNYVTEITEKLRTKEERAEAEEYAKIRDENRRNKMLMKLMETDDAMNNLYIFHLKFLQKWNFPAFMAAFMNFWNDFGLFNYNTHTQHTLGLIKFLNNLEDIGGIHEGDELLVVVNEPNHEVKIYFKDNFIPHGFDGTFQNTKTPQQRVQYEKWKEFCENNPFKCVLDLKTDLLAECFKVFFLTNSKTCKVTTPDQVDVDEMNSELQKIINKYNL